jgi:hypothetical protein
MNLVRTSRTFIGGTPFHGKSRLAVERPLETPMTSREHARRLMLILLASEGTALRKAADDRMLLRRDRVGATRNENVLQGSGSTDVSGEARERRADEWRMWAAPSALGTAPRVP